MLLWNPKVHKELSLIPVTGLSHEPDWFLNVSR
jgi:hypothetical protein